MRFVLGLVGGVGGALDGEVTCLIWGAFEEFYVEDPGVCEELVESYFLIMGNFPAGES